MKEIHHYYKKDKNNKNVVTKEEIKETKQCYPAEEVVALNKALRLSDIIGLLGIYIAVMGLLIPLLGYLTMSHEKEKIERFIKDARIDIKDVQNQTNTIQNTTNENIENSRNELRQSEERALEKITAMQKEHWEYIRSTLNIMPKIQKEAIEARSKYISHRLMLIKEKEGDSELDFNEELGGCLSIAHDLEYSILSMSGNSKDKKEAFGLLTSYVSAEDVLKNEGYVAAIDSALYLCYKARFFSMPNDKKPLIKFIETKLDTTVGEWVEKHKNAGEVTC